MKQKSKKIFLSSALSTIGTICLCFGFAFLDVPAATPVAAETAENAVSDYVVQYYDDFSNGKITASWYDVSGNRAKDGEWIFGEDETSVVWGNGTTADSGKMLYDVGATEYVVSADVKLSPTKDDDTYTNINMHFPIIVTKSGTANAFEGVSINFRNTDAVFYLQGVPESGTEVDGNSDNFINTIGSDTANARITYSKVPGYKDADSWFAAAHNWKSVVSTDYIDFYVDGCFMVRVERPDYTADATVCGIAGNSVSGNSFSSIEYDNFTVWTKGEKELQKSDVIESLFTSGEYSYIGNEYASVISYDKDTQTAKVGYPADYGNRLVDGLNIKDFNVSLVLGDNSDYPLKYISASNSFVFRAAYIDDCLYGYAVNFNIQSSGTGTVRFAKITKLPASEALITSGYYEYIETSSGTSSISYTIGDTLSISVDGNEFALTVTSANGTATTMSVTDDTYPSGSIGITTRTVYDANKGTSGTGGYSIAFKEFYGEEVKLEDQNPERLFVNDAYTYTTSVTNKGMSWDATTQTATIKYGTALNRVVTDLVYDDFTVTYSIEPDKTEGNSGTQYRLNNATGLYFRASNTDGYMSGYQVLVFGDNNATPYIYLYKIANIKGGTAPSSSTTDCAKLIGGFKTEYGKDITISAQGSYITLTYYSAASTTYKTVSVVDSTYASGSMGMTIWSNATTGGVVMKFSEMKLNVLNYSGSKTLSSVAVKNTEGEVVGYVPVRDGGEISVNDFKRENYLVGFKGENGVSASVTATGAALENALTLNGYQLEDGAAVRLNADSSGLRFTTQISKEVYESLNGYVSYGTLMIPTETLGSNELTLNTTDVLNIANESGVLFVEEEGVYKFRAALTDIPEEAYDQAISARGYATVTYADGTQKTFYTVYTAENNSRSIKQVALSALLDEEETYTTAQESILMKYAGIPYDFEQATVSASAAGYPRIEELSDGSLYLVASKNYSVGSVGEEGVTFPAYTVLYATEEKDPSGEYTLTRGNAQPFVLSDGRVVVMYRAYNLEEIGYSSIRMIIGDEKGANFGTPVILVQNYEQGTDKGYSEYGMWEPHAVQKDNTLLVYFSCDIHSSIDYAGVAANAVPLCTDGRQNILLAQYDLTENEVTSVTKLLDGLADGGYRYGMSVITKLADGSYAMVIEAGRKVTLEGGKEDSVFDIRISYSQDGVTGWTTPVVLFGAEEFGGASTYCGAPFVTTLPDGRIAVSYQSTYQADQFTIKRDGRKVQQSRVRVFVSVNAVNYNSEKIEFVELTEQLGITYAENQYSIWNSVSVVGDKLYVLIGKGVNTSETTSVSGATEVYYASIK